MLFKLIMDYTKRKDSRRLGSEAQIYGLNDPNLNFMGSVKEWEADLNKKRKWEKSIGFYIIIIMIIIFIFYVVLKYAFLLI
jgi:hypothetical protein